MVTGCRYAALPHHSVHRLRHLAMEKGRPGNPGCADAGNSRNQRLRIRIPQPPYDTVRSPNGVQKSVRNESNESFFFLRI